MSLLGVVMAGGGSRRFGSQKALARLHGKPLWEIAADLLGTVTPDVVGVVNDASLADRIGLECRPDVRPDHGPLAGVETALGWARERNASGVIVLACDMPWVDRRVVEALVQAWVGGQILVPKSDGPWGFEPLSAVYPIQALGPVGDALALGRLELGAFVAAQSPLIVDVKGVGLDEFRSVNRPGDLPPPAVAVIGNKNSGKTTLAVGLIAELAGRGREVMSAKHGHHFRLDAEGTDSWRHRHEGSAERVLLAGPEQFALMGAWGAGGEPSLDRLLAMHLGDAEIVVAEGFRTSRLPKVEIFRSKAQPEPILDPAGARAAGALATVTDQPDLPWSVPVFDPDAPDLIPRLTDLVERALL